MTTFNKYILLIDKERGMTSFDVIRELRKRLGVRKMGHAGTLDPLATGLLIVGVGEGTKKLHGLTKLPKVYEADILLGKETDTYDREGKVLSKKDAGGLSDKEIRKALLSLRGSNQLSVPLYSAVKIDGRPLYDYARKGEKVAVPVRDMVVRDVHLAHINDVKEGEYTYKMIRTVFDVESGVYIRSLAHELGKRLGVPSMLYFLRRTSIGAFNVEDAHSINDF